RPVVRRRAFGDRPLRHCGAPRGDPRLSVEGPKGQRAYPPPPIPSTGSVTLHRAPRPTAPPHPPRPMASALLPLGSPPAIAPRPATLAFTPTATRPGFKCRHAGPSAPASSALLLSTLLLSTLRPPDGRSRGPAPRGSPDVPASRYRPPLTNPNWGA